MHAQTTLFHYITVVYQICAAGVEMGFDGRECW